MNEYMENPKSQWWVQPLRVPDVQLSVNGSFIGSMLFIAFSIPKLNEKYPEGDLYCII